MAFDNQRSRCKKVTFFTNTQSRFASVVIDSGLGPLNSSWQHLTVSSALCGSGSSVQDKVEVPWRSQCQPKRPFKESKPDQWSCWKELKRIIFSIDFPPDKSIEKKFVLVAWSGGAASNLCAIRSSAARKTTQIHAQKRDQAWCVEEKGQSADSLCEKSKNNQG